MSKVVCACIECKHNKNGICKKKEINLANGNIATVYEGRQNVWWCRMFELSDFAKEINEMLRKVIPNDR